MPVERLGPDFVAISGPGLSASAVAATIERRPLFFSRHVTAEIMRTSRVDPGVIFSSVSKVELPDTSQMAVQAWATGKLRHEHGPADLAQAASDALRSRGCAALRANTEWVLSICVTPEGAFLGVNQAKDSLADWPGGRVRLSRGEQLVSRSELKLEELLKIYPGSIPAQGKAMDFGAAPGGWTRIVRSRGIEVWAIDPGELDRRILSDPGVHYFSTTVGDFLRSATQKFDFVVNDMRMDPVRSSRVLVDAARCLRAGAVAILTLKLGVHDVRPCIERCLRILGEKYDVAFGRSLFHNRHEVTLVLIRR